MNKPNHICKNPDCGAAYYWCDGCNINKNDEWGKVGCCPECAQIYWDLIEKSRTKINVKEAVPAVLILESDKEIEIVEQEEPEFTTTNTNLKPKRKAKPTNTEEE